MKKISRFVIFLLLLILAVAGTGTADVAPKTLEAKSPEFAVTQFYGWYLHALNQNIYPLDSKRSEIKKYVTEKLILTISKMLKGPGGLDGDYFVDAQEWAPAWEKNIKVVKSITRGKESVIDLTLAGPQNPNHKLHATLVNENGIWKIDKVETGK